MNYEIIHYPNDEKPIYLSVQAAYIACISLEFLLACEAEELIKPRNITEESPGYTLQDIHRLQIIRRLHEDLDLDLETIEVVLHLREQIEDLAEERNSLKRMILDQQAELNRLKKILGGVRSAV